MLIVTYEYKCDFCEALICGNDRCELPAGMLRPPLPQPRCVAEVGNYHACASCMELAMKPLRKRFAELHPMMETDTHYIDLAHVPERL